MSSRGVFVTFEGGEGAGKSTQVAYLRERLEDQGRRVVQLREPGGTKFGEALRELLLSSTTLATRTEMLLFLAARSELVDKVVGPALRNGLDVICDRFIDSTLAYQGYGRGLDLELIRILNDAVIEGCVPDLTVLLDVDPDVGLTRVSDGAGGDSFEGHWQAGLTLQEQSEAAAERAGKRVGGRDRAFHRKVRRGYLTLARSDPGRWLVLDATRAQEEIADAVWQRVFQLVRERAETSEGIDRP
jgi:dTMP kinase